MNKATQFYYDNAGYSYNPKTETKEQGRLRCAESLAEAARQATDAGITFAWDIDRDIDSSEWTDEQPAWQTFNCVALDRQGVILASLCGIDFGRDGDPHYNEYSRVVEAELALEAI